MDYTGGVKLFKRFKASTLLKLRRFKMLTQTLLHHSGYAKVKSFSIGAEFKS